MPCALFYLEDALSQVAQVRVVNDMYSEEVVDSKVLCCLVSAVFDGLLVVLLEPVDVVEA